jgi:hypothetical protein
VFIIGLRTDKQNSERLILEPCWYSSATQQRVRQRALELAEGEEERERESDKASPLAFHIFHGNKPYCLSCMDTQSANRMATKASTYIQSKDIHLH